jgi:hypothetical protein
MKREWPDWTPPPQMLKRRPDLPRQMAGGIDNPLGARAIYLGSSTYRIHGSNDGYDRCRRVVGLHKNDQPGRCRSCRSGQNRHESRRAPVIFRLLRYHAAKLRQNRHRRRRLAVRRAFASILIYQPDSGMLAAMKRCLRSVPMGACPTALKAISYQSITRCTLSKGRNS